MWIRDKGDIVNHRFFGRLVFVAFLGLAAIAGARAQEKKDDAPAEPQRIEYLRVPLYSVFHPDKDTEARLERGLYIGGPKANSQDFRLPIDVPVGSTIMEVGIVGQTTNQMTVRLERSDWTPVYAVGETQPKESGSWSCLAIVEKGMLRKVGKPVADDDKAGPPRREFEEQEFVVNVSLARSPNASKEEKMSHAAAQRDKVTALWVKISR